MKVLLLGSSGQLGSSFKEQLSKKKKIELSIYDKRQKKKFIDFVYSDLKKIIYSEKPNIVINTVAFTNVDLAEVNKKVCYKVNVLAVKKIAKACKKIGAKLIHFSTDYVYGKKFFFFISENKKKNPINFYSKSKLLSEKTIIKNKCDYVIFRIPWVYNLNKDNNFIKKIINKILMQKSFSVVDDQFGQPTSTEFVSSFVSKNLLKIYNLKKGKIYNLCPSGYASRYDIANFLYKFMVNKKIIKKKISILKLKTEQLNKLPRQLNSVLSNNKIKVDFKLNFLNWKFYLKKSLKNFYEK